MNCKNCGQCCSYVTIPLDTPTTKREYDMLIWALYHENIWVFLDHDGDWFIEFKTKCKALTKENLCGVYEKRPDICRNHDPENCEFNNKESPYKEVFKTVEELEKYFVDKKIKLEDNE